MPVAILTKAAEGAARGRRIPTREVHHLLAIALTCGSMFGCGNTERVDSNRIVTDFASHTYDRSIFRAQGALRGPAYGRWDLTSPGLRAIRPPGELDRPPLLFMGRFRLEGDFEITAHFSIAKLPRPKTKQGSNRIAIALDGPDRFASVFRAATHGGDVYDYEINGNQTESESQSVPTRATTGGLSARRRGTALSFWRSEAGGELEQLGSAEFDSGPISGVAFLADARDSGDGFDVRFDRIEILADRIVRVEPDFGEGTPWWLLAIGLFAASGIAVLIIRRWRNGR